MTALILLVAFVMIGNAGAVLELDCSDNATCIDHMAKEVIRSLKQHRSVKLFDSITIEPLARRQGRSVDWLTGFMENHAFSFDWNDYEVRISRPQDGSNVLDLEIYQGRTATDVSDPNAKKSSSKAEEEKEEDKTPKGIIRRRRHKKKVLQAIIPLLFGMKSAGIVMFGMAVVTVLTFKAFVASKLALLVTAGMAMKRLYEAYGSGVGLQSNPYLPYSQYPIDFPSASSHAYSMSGVNPQFAAPEMYSPSAMGQHQNEILHQHDASAQQSQQEPLLMNATRAAERWDGKSKLQKLIEPVIDGFKNFVSPIANIFYGAIPATFRGLNSDVSTTNNTEEAVEKVKEILVAQPRLYAQRKMSQWKLRPRPKKYTELKVNLDRLKDNKDLYDYIKTKKYKYNYPNTYFYPRIKYLVNPQIFYKPNNSRLVPYRKEASNVVKTVLNLPLLGESEWKPILINSTYEQMNDSKIKKSVNATEVKKRNAPKKPRRKLRRRSKRSVEINELRLHTTNNDTKRGFLDVTKYIFTIDPLESLINFSQAYMKTAKKGPKKAPVYYSFTYNILMMCLDAIEGMVAVNQALIEEFVKTKTKKKKHGVKKNET